MLSRLEISHAPEMTVPNSRVRLRLMFHPPSQSSAGTSLWTNSRICTPPVAAMSCAGLSALCMRREARSEAWRSSSHLISSRARLTARADRIATATMTTQGSRFGMGLRL